MRLSSAHCLALNFTPKGETLRSCIYQRDKLNAGHPKLTHASEHERWRWLAGFTLRIEAFVVAVVDSYAPLDCINRPKTLGSSGANGAGHSSASLGPSSSADAGAGRRLAWQNWSTCCGTPHRQKHQIARERTFNDLWARHARKLQTRIGHYRDDRAARQPRALTLISVSLCSARSWRCTPTDMAITQVPVETRVPFRNPAAAATSPNISVGVLTGAVFGSRSV